MVISHLVCSPFIIAGVSGVPKISEVGSKQVGTELPNDLIMILINRSAVVRSAVNLLPKVEGKQYL